MITFLIVTISVTLIAFAALEYFEERVTSKRRMALATSARTIAINTLDKDKIIAKLAKLNTKKSYGKLTIADYLIRAGLRYEANQVRGFIAFLTLLVAFLAFIFLNSYIVAIVAGAFIAIVVPRLVFSILITRREAAFLEELPNALEMISRGLRAGMTLGTCLKQVVESTKDPVRSEFAYIVDLQKLGMPISDAIRKLADRIDLLDVRFFTIVIEIQQKSGGNLAEILENISRVIRGRRELRAKIKSLISEAKVSSIIIAIIPIGFGAMGYMNDPESFSKFLTEPVGRILLAISIGLYLSGAGIFIKLANPKI